MNRFVSVWVSLFIGCLFPITAQAGGWGHAEDGAQLWYNHDAKELKRLFAKGIGPVMPLKHTFLRLGVRWDGPNNVELQARFQLNNGLWTTWQHIRETWNEKRLHVGHTDVSYKDIKAAQLRHIGEGRLTSMVLVFIQKLGPVANQLSPTQSTLLNPGKGYALTAGPFHPRSKWQAKAAKCSSADTVKNRMAIHHAYTPNNDSSTPEARMRSIQHFHQNTRGWCDIGYHAVISLDGQAWEARPWNVLGTHTGSNNSKNFGVCFLGTWDTTTPNQKMLCRAAVIVDWGVTQLGVPRNRTSIKGHREHSGQSTTCPGNSLLAQVSSIVSSSTNAAQTCNIQPPKCDYVKISTATLNIRKGPGSSNFGVAGTVSKDTCLKVLQKDTNGQSVQGNTTWYKITHNNVTGWIAGYYAPCSDCGPATPVKGSLKGFVHLASDTTKKTRIDGATVKLDNGQSVTTQADGTFTFSLDAKVYQLTVSKAGFQEHSQSVTITAGQTNQLEIALSPKTSADTQPPTIAFTAPMNDSHHQTADLAITGTIKDNVSVDRAEYNGQSLSLNASGEFTLNVTLQPGKNEFTIKAWDAANNEGTAKLTLHYDTSSERTPQPDAGTQPDTKKTQPDTTTTPPEQAPQETTPQQKDGILQLGACQTNADCQKGYSCKEGSCRQDSTLQPSGSGCACVTQSNHDNFSWSLFVLLFLLVGYKKKRA